MKKSLLFVMMLLLVVGTSFGQKGKPAQKNNASPEMRAKRQTANLTKELLLSTDQQTKVYDLILARMNSLSQVKAKYKGAVKEKEQRKTELKAVRDNYEQGMKATLSPEQFEKWSKARAEKIKKAKSKVKANAKKAVKEKVEEVDETELEID